MRNITGHIGKLEIVRRLPSSKNGNPRFLLRVDGWTCRTAPDSMDGYAVQNMDGRTVVATIGTHYGQATLESVRPSHRYSYEREAIRHQHIAAFYHANGQQEASRAASHNARAYLFLLIDGIEH